MTQSDSVRNVRIGSDNMISSTFSGIQARGRPTEHSVPSNPISYGNPADLVIAHTFDSDYPTIDPKSPNGRHAPWFRYDFVCVFILFL